MTPEQIFDRWALQVTGISQRHIYDNDFNNPPNPGFIGDTENMAAEASKRALENTGLTAENIDYIVFATFTPAVLVPNPACSLSSLLGINVPGIPINTACSGFIDGLIEAFCRISTGRYKNVLVVAAETLSKTIDYNDPRTAVLFGDGAGAVVLQHSNTGILGFYSGAEYSPDQINYSANYSLQKQFLTMNGGPHVLKNAVRAMDKAARNALADAHLSLQDVDYVITHQANRRIIDGVVEALGLPRSKFIETINKYGNTSAASAAISLDKALRGEVEGCTLKKGDTLLLTAVGGGYTYASVVLKI